MTTSTRSLRRVHVRLNGLDQTIDIRPDATLLDLLRDRLGLTGTKAGCERGECGSCTVLRGGRPIYACLLLAAECEGDEIVTIEGLAVDDPVIAAIVAEDGLQCGYCTPGQALAITALLEAHPDPTDEQILEGLSGNLCRCGAYAGLIRATRRAAAVRRRGPVEVAAPASGAKRRSQRAAPAARSR